MRCFFFFLSLICCSLSLDVVSADPQFVLETELGDVPAQTFKGYNGVNVKILDEEGNFFCYSKALERPPFIQRQDSLSDFISELNKEGLNETQGFKIFLDISRLARGRFRFSPREFSGLVSGLSDHYVFTGITSEPMTEEAQNFIYLAASDSGKKLNLRAVSPAFENYIFPYAEMDLNLTRSPERWITSDATSTIIVGDIAFALGRALEKPVWASSADHNLLLYRAVQYFPSGFFLQVPEKPTEDPRGELLELAKMGTPKDKKPVANLVLGPAKAQKFTIPQMMNGIVNALNANGYEIRVTFESLLKEAELYYVIGREEWLDDLPFFNKIIKLLDTRRSRFYGPVILEPMGEIKNKSRWKDLRKHFHIPDTEVGWVDEIPSYVKERGRRIAWGGDPAPKGSGMTSLRAEPVRHEGGEVILSELVGTQTLALILKSQNHFLINGTPLHLESGYILSKLAGGSLKAPAMAYVTSGRFLTAAFALEDTHLTIKIPTPEPPLEWRKILYDEKGKRVLDVLIPGSDSIEADLSPRELIIFQAVLP